jgi:DNA-binding response OmpR family regulator
MEVFVKDKKVDLTLTEFKILTKLASKPGWVFSREQLISAIWGGEKDVFDRTIDVHIKKLRDKLGEVGKFIKSVRGVGYKIEMPDEE